jgi:hypothetical protein
MKNTGPSTICFVESGFCYKIHQYPPIHWEPFLADEGNTQYANLIGDVQALHLINQASKVVADDAARTALQSGINSSLQAIEKRAQGKVKIRLSE